MLRVGVLNMRVESMCFFLLACFIFLFFVLCWSFFARVFLCCVRVEQVASGLLSGSVCVCPCAWVSTGVSLNEMQTHGPTSCLFVLNLVTVCLYST